MGREIKRVALDFDWPMDVSWKGYHNPYSAVQCKQCGGSGLNVATKKLSDEWYHHLRIDGKDGWQHHLVQEEVDALVDAGRLHDLTHIFIPGEGWRPRPDGGVPTVQEVNDWSRRGFGHDSVNQWICVETRAKQRPLLVRRQIRTTSRRLAARRAADWRRLAGLGDRVRRKPNNPGIRNRRGFNPPPCHPRRWLGPKARRRRLGRASR